MVAKPTGELLIEDFLLLWSALHRMRHQLVKFRTAQINGLRGLLAEYGEVMPQRQGRVRKGISKALPRLADRLPAVLIDTLRE